MVICKMVSSVNWTLKNKFDTVLISGQLGSAERAGSMERMSTMWQWDLGPVFGRLLRAHMPTRGESICWRTSINIKACLAPEPERHIGTNGSAHRTLTLVGFCVATVPPVVIAMDVATAEVSPGLFLFHHFLAVDAGKGQRVQPHGALGSRCIDLLP